VHPRTGQAVHEFHSVVEVEASFSNYSSPACQAAETRVVHTGTPRGVQEMKKVTAFIGTARKQHTLCGSSVPELPPIAWRRRIRDRRPQ
jgi:hypothetical protein